MTVEPHRIQLSTSSPAVLPLPRRRRSVLAPAALRRIVESRLVRFAMVGSTGVVVNLGTLWALAELVGVRDVIASALAVEVSIVWNFFLNNAFTYRDRNAAAQAGLGERLVRYNLVSLVGLAIQLGTFVLVRALVLHAAHREALGALRYVAQSAGIVLAMAWSFTGHLHFTWRQVSAKGAAGSARRASGPCLGASPAGRDW